MVGLEPATMQLRSQCSATELRRIGEKKLKSKDQIQPHISSKNHG